MQKIATKLTQRIAEFVNEVTGFRYFEDENYFHYPRISNQDTKFFEGDHSTCELKTHLGYKEVTEQEFINIVTEDIKPKEIMKTKCIVLRQENEPVKELKPIEFVKFMSHEKTIDPRSEPRDYQNVELICRDYLNSDLDLIFAYNDDRNEGRTYLGHWNDGVAE